MATHRISHEPAYVLHRYDWSESSLILEVFTRHHGRVALVAKGVKRPSSNFRPVLLPLQPLELAFGGDAEIRTLKGAEWVGGHIMPTGDALMSGYYLNELLMRLLARDDPHPGLFDAYAAAVRLLATGFQGAGSDGLQLTLRAFELVLLREIGLLPELHLQTASLAPLDGEAPYVLLAEGGLRDAHDDDASHLPGAQWQALQAALDSGPTSASVFAATLRACAPALGPLRSQLRQVLHYHCGVATLHTRQLMVDLQNL